MTKYQKLSSLPVSRSVRRLLVTLTAAFLATALLQGQSPAAPASGPAQASAPVSAPASQGRKPFAPSLPLFFEKNDGQFDGRAGFLARMPNATLYLTGADAVLVHSTKATDEASAIRMHWAGSSDTKAPEGEAEMAGRSNYFIGNDQSHWHTGVANFQRVQQRDLYPGVDLVYYGNQQQLEYDLTVQPGASPSRIRLAIEGAKSVALDKATGDLVLVDAVGSPLRLLKPVVYQLDDKQARTSIAGAYVLSAQNTVSFVLGDYDHSRPLVIDPEVVYSTMFGGTTLETANEGTSPNNLYTGMTVDSNGDVYLSGVTSTINLPATAGAFQSTCNLYDSGALCSNFFVAKFDPTQSGPASLIYATYIGGNAQDYVYQNDGVKYNIAVDSQFDAYIVGKVSQGIYGSGYPTTSNAFVPTCTVAITGPTCSGVLTKLDPTGATLLYSTWLADSYSLAEPAMVSVDSNQVAYVAGTGGSGPESFLAAYPTSGSATGSISYSVGLPFSVMSLAVDPSGNAYVGGESFQGTENGATGYQLIDFNGAVTTLGAGDFPGVFVKFNSSGQNVYATFFGDGSFNGANGVWGVAADPDGIAYVTGDDANVVQVNGLPSGAGTTFGAYVAEVDTTQTGPASLLYSTYIYAGDFNNETWAIASNGAGQFAFSGISDGVNTYPVTNPLTQPIALPTSSPSNPQFIGMIDPSKSGQQALIFLSFVDGVDEALTLFIGQGTDGGGGGGPFSRPAVKPKPEVEVISGPFDYNLFVAGYGLAGYAANPFLTGPSLASYSTSLAANQTIAPFFYKIALGPIDCITVSPYSLAFPTQEVGTTSPPLSFTVTNTCTYLVDIASITPSPTFNESDNCTPSLPAGNVCTVQVTFEPTVASTTPVSGLVSVNVENSNAPISVAVSGTGVSATTATGWVSPQNIAFSPEPNGGVSAPVTVTYTNTGSVALGNGVTSMIVVSQAASDPFVIVNNGCGKSLAVGANCQFQVEFAPTTTTALYTPSNKYTQPLYAEGQSPTLTMNLTGTGGVVLTPATLVSPTPGLSTILGTSNVTFQWTTIPGATDYQLNLSAISAGGHDLFLYKGTATTATATALPEDDVTVYATLYTKIDGVWVSNSYQYTESGTPAPATLTSPTPGLSTILGANDVQFQWTTGGRVSEYQLNLSAVSAGASDLFLYKGTATSATAASLPVNANEVYARLYSKINGAWQYNDYVYTESGTPTPAALTSPTPGLSTTLGATDVQFQWTGGVDVADFQLNLSAISPGGSDLYTYKGTALTATAPNLPTSGAEVYARLYSKINGVWQYNDYVYTEGGTPTPATLTSPTPGLGTILGTNSVTFQWTAGIAVADYQLNLSAVAAGGSDLYLYKGTALTATAPSLPANGVTVYARLYSKINGAWQYIDYVYTEQ